MKMRLFGWVFVAAISMGAIGLGLTGCAAEKPQSTVSRGLESGVTSNNGGGMAPARFGNVTVPAK